MNKVAVLPATGIGDGLLMLIASHQLRLAGCDVTTFHPALPELHSWFPQETILTRPEPKELLAVLPRFDKIIVENDNSAFITKLRESLGSKLSLFFPSYSLAKHGPLQDGDCAFSPHLNMADNIQRAVSKLTQCNQTSKNNGITPPEECKHRYYQRQVVISPTSGSLEKNWTPKKFFKLAQKLKRHSFLPIFALAPKERAYWLWIEEKGLPLPHLPTLASLARLIYESGYVIGNDSLAGHLASNLHIPAVIIANNPARMRLWQPGWFPAQCVFPPSLLPNIKGFRWRDTKWQAFITVNKVFKNFKNVN